VPTTEKTGHCGESAHEETPAGSAGDLPQEPQRKASPSGGAGRGGWPQNRENGVVLVRVYVSHPLRRNRATTLRRRRKGPPPPTDKRCPRISPLSDGQAHHDGSLPRMTYLWSCSATNARSVLPSMASKDLIRRASSAGRATRTVRTTSVSPINFFFIATHQPLPAAHGGH
jgi:hypothetical protein